jgi:hypothetical protein
VTGIEIAVGAYLLAWAKKRGKTAADRVGNEADNAVAKLLDRLHDVVERKLGAGSQGLTRLEAEAREGREQLSDSASGLLSMSLKVAAEDDPAFLRELTEVFTRLKAAEAASAGAGSGSGAVSGNTFNDAATVQTGDVGGDVHNTISGGTQNGPVFQGRDFHGGIVIGMPAKPQQPDA